jgi:peptidyl-dipeptidase A
MDVKKFLENVNADLKMLHTKSASSYWNLTTTGKGEYMEEVEKAEIELRMYLASKERFEAVKEAMELELDSIEKRQIKLLFDSMLPNQLPKESIEAAVKKEVEIEGLFANFRANIDGKEVSNNEITEILEKSTDAELRKKAWIAGKEIGKEVAPKLIELIKIRNENAKQLGFENYYDMMMELQELSAEQIHSMFRSFKKQTDDLFKEVKDDIDTILSEKFKINKEDVKPWHYSDIWFQEVPTIDTYEYDSLFTNKDIINLVKKTYESIGLDISDIIERSDLYERKGKNQHAFTISIDTENDIRVLENIRPNVKWAETTLHEYGHAVYDKYIDKSLPVILRSPAHIFTTEAVAMFFGRRARDVEWYGKILNLNETTLKEIEPRLKKLLKYQLAITSRWVIAFVFFEKELYLNPDSPNLNSLWYNTLQELQFISVPDERHALPDWAAKIHFGTAPVYYHNYLLGEMMASQMENFIKENISSELINKNVGEFFVDEIFRPGSKHKWDELIEKATGKPLSPEFLANQLK